MMAAGKYSVKPMWRPVHRAWMQLGEALELDDNILERAETQQNAVELPVAKRCAWAECLCNAFKPAHGLRVCNGCSAVAYCNKKCQRRYAVPRPESAIICQRGLFKRLGESSK